VSRKRAGSEQEVSRKWAGSVVSHLNGSEGYLIRLALACGLKGKLDVEGARGLTAHPFVPLEGGDSDTTATRGWGQLVGRKRGGESSTVETNEGERRHPQ
jgi:hypothetical protein